MIETSSNAALAERLVKISARLALQEKKIDTLAKRMPSNPGPVWTGLDAAAEAAQLADLRQWVADVLTDTERGYGDWFGGRGHALLPACWPRHRAVVLILTPVWAEWQRCFLPDQPHQLADQLNFHGRVLWGLDQLLRKAIGSDCGERGKCTRPGPSPTS